MIIEPRDQDATARAAHTLASVYMAAIGESMVAVLVLVLVIVR